MKKIISTKVKDKNKIVLERAIIENFTKIHNIIKRSDDIIIHPLSEEEVTVNLNLLLESNKDVIEEGWKEVLLGTLMLMNVGLSGVNAQTAKKAVDDPNTLKQIEQTLESNKIVDLANELENIGLTNAMDKIQKNAKTIENNFNKAANQKGLKTSLVVKKASDLEDVKTQLDRGYAVKGVEMTVDTILVPGDVVITEVNGVTTISNDDLFSTGGFNLNEGSISGVLDLINEIKSKDGKVTKITIEASTDTEPISMGNDKLAELRAESVKKLLDSAGVDIEIEIVTKPDSGPNIYSRNMSSEDREKARNETSEYRYVKISIEGLTVNKTIDEISVPELINKYEVELVKLVGTSKPTTGTSKTGKTKLNVSCKAVKHKGKKMNCPRF